MEGALHEAAQKIQPGQFCGGLEVPLGQAYRLLRSRGRSSADENDEASWAISTISFKALIFGFWIVKVVSRGGF